MTSNLVQERINALLAELAHELGTRSDRQLAQAITANYGIRISGMTIFRWRRGQSGASLIQLLVARQSPPSGPPGIIAPVRPGHHKLSPADVVEVRAALDRNEQGTAIARRFDVSASLISRIKHRNRHIGT